MGLLFARRRPLLRAAAVGGIGAMAYRAGRRSQAEVEHEQDQDARLGELSETGYGPGGSAAPAPVYLPPPRPDRIAELERLGALRQQGVLTADEFEAEKRRILGS